MTQPQLFPETKPDDRDDGEWLCCPRCGCIAELDDWDVLGIDEDGTTLYCNHCDDEVTPLKVSERKRK